MSKPILSVSNPTRNFMVCKYTSLEGIGVVMMQDGWVIAYELRKLKDHKLNYPMHHLELPMVFYALLRWRHFLLGHNFEIHSNHQSLKYIITQPNLNARHRH